MSAVRCGGRTCRICPRRQRSRDPYAGRPATRHPTVGSRDPGGPRRADLTRDAARPPAARSWHMHGVSPPQCGRLAHPQRPAHGPSALKGNGVRRTSPPLPDAGPPRRASSTIRPLRARGTPIWTSDGGSSLHDAAPRRILDRRATAGTCVMGYVNKDHGIVMRDRRRQAARSPASPSCRAARPSQRANAQSGAPGDQRRWWYA